MDPYAILALFGLGILATISGGSDTDEDDTPVVPEDPTPPVPTGETFGTDGDDEFNNFGTTEPLFYDLGAGMDNVQAGDGNDTVVSTSGITGVGGGGGDDLLFGGSDDDELNGGLGNDTVSGRGGDDNLFNTRGENEIFGGAGDDFIRLAGGSTATGGAGMDYFEMFLDDQNDSVVTITDFETGIDKIGSPESEGRYDISLTVSDGHTGTLSYVENADGVDIFDGETLVATVAGATAADFDGLNIFTRLNETGGEVTGSDCADALRGSANADTLNGGAGDDFLTTSAFSFGTGADVLNGDGGNDTLLGFGAYVSDQPDTGPFATPEPNTMDGGDGDDLLVSYATNTLTGGAGADTFALAHSGTADGPILITDFNQGEDEIILDYVAESDRAALSISVWEDGGGADVLVSGDVIVRVTGGQGLTVSDIGIAPNSIEQDLLD